MEGVRSEDLAPSSFFYPIAWLRTPRSSNVRYIYTSHTMKQLLFLPLMLITTFALAQQYSLDFNGGIDNTASENKLIQFNNTTLVNSNSIYFGVSYNQTLFGSTYIKTGINYLSTTRALVKPMDRWPLEITPYGFEPHPDLPNFERRVWKDQYLEVPLMLRQYFLSRQRGLFIEGGVIGSYHFNTLHSTMTPNNFPSLETYTHDQSQLTITASMAIGYEQYITPRLNVFIQPALRYSPGSNRYLEKKVLRLGLQIGGRFKFGDQKST